MSQTHLSKPRKRKETMMPSALFQATGHHQDSGLAPPTWKTLYTHASATAAATEKKFLSRHHFRSATNPPPVGSRHDLWANSLLSVLFPTHGLAHLVHFGVGAVALLYGLIHFAWKAAAVESNKLMTYAPPIAFGALLVFWSFWHKQTIRTQLFQRKPWMDPKTTSYKRMDMHVPLRLFASVENARKAACRPDLPAVVTAGNDDKEQQSSLTSNVWRLDSPMPWQFQLFPTVEDALEARQEDAANIVATATNDNQWPSLPVPGHWVLEDCLTKDGKRFKHDDIPVYTNQKTPFRPCAPPFVPTKNPTGLYKLDLAETMWPKEWVDDEQSGSGNLHQYSILLHGVESACFVYWNGRLIGYGQDSRLPSEFHIPNDILFDNDNQNASATLHIVVPKFTDGSYLELQDHWKFGGIHRSVEIVRRPRQADIMDFHVLANHQGGIQVSVSLRESIEELMTAKTIRVRLFADEQLNADGSKQKLATEELWSATQVVRGESVVTFHDTINDIKSWTAETPILYTLIIEQITDSDNTNTITQCESCRVGFRSIQIDHHGTGGGIIKVNDKAVTICGINRHEHDPDHGKVVSMARMMQDITTLKQNNFNAIRNSHYPTHSSFYRLCDYYGMYVCDEANIETHGLKPMGRLAHDKGWANAFVERVSRTVQRDYNHACIIFWSLGNEAGRGRNLILARQRLMQLDSTRPVCYESGMSWSDGTGRSELTDVVCPMYPEIPKLMNLHQRDDEDRPIVLCEYSHAMSNSNGNLHMYWEKFWDPKYPRCQGGFIWDYIDQGLRKKASNGQDFYAYGGDFGPNDTNNDRQFCINGMFTPEREPHPAVEEIKYLQQPVSVEAGSSNHLLGLKILEDNTVMLVNPTNGGVMTKISLSNRYSFLNLSHLSWKWHLTCNNSLYAMCTGTAADENGILSFDTASMASALREIQEKHPNVQWFLNIIGFLAEETSWAQAGHVVVKQQFPLSIDHDGTNSPKTNASPLLTSQQALLVNDEQYRVAISNGNSSLPFVAIGKLSGAVTSVNWSKDGAFDSNILGHNDMEASYTRATTDNDRGGLELTLDHMRLTFAQPLLQYTPAFDFFSHYLQWKEGGLTQDTPPNLVCDKLDVTEDDGIVRIVADCSVKTHQHGQTIMKQTTTYYVYRDGCIKATYKIVPTKRLRDIPSLPRIGLSLELNPSLYNIQYFGLGPNENYPDRKTGSTMGVWKTSPSKMGFDYIVPSENGNRCDCEWISFQDVESNNGMLVMADKNSKICFSALLHSASELNAAEHTCDLNVRQDGKDPIFVNIDHQLMGLGGDNSWLPCVYPEYLVKANQEYEYSVWLIPLARRADPKQDIAAFANRMKDRLPKTH